LVFFAGNVSEEALSILYNNSNYFFGYEYMDYLKEKTALQRNFLDRIKDLRKFFPGRGKLFEIGSAYGFFLELAQKYWQVKGIDLSADAYAYARKVLGVEVMCGDFLSCDIEDDYDIFCMWDTIEHLKYPHLYIQKISTHVKPNGLLCITTGDIQSLVARLQREKWRQIHPPTHLFYFSKRSIAFLINRFGFEIVHLSKCVNYRNLDAMLYGLLVLRNRKEWKNKLYQTIRRVGLLQKVDLKLNLYDIMFVIARKR